MRFPIAALAALALASATAVAQDKPADRPANKPAAPAAAAPAAADASDKIMVELNALDPIKDICRVSFVIKNPAPEPLSSIKLDLAVFNPDGIVQRRLVAELGPVRAAKTMVKAFELDRPCAQLGSLLVNDVAECAPADPANCLDRLQLASRAPGVRFFK